jgi:hypothetical protein
MLAIFFQKQANSFARKTANRAQDRQQRHTPIFGGFFLAENSRNSCGRGRKEEEVEED